MISCPLSPASERSFTPHPQVIPVFIAGLGNDLPKQIMGNWTGGPKVRIWFGEKIDLTEFYSKRDAIRTHKEIADHLMAKIGELGDEDREAFLGSTEDFSDPQRTNLID